MLLRFVRKISHKALLVVATYGLVSLSVASSVKGAQFDSPSSNSRNVPVTLWAWEHDEDLSFLKSPDISVAYYAGTIYVNRDLVFFRPRLQRLKLSQGQIAYPVFRIETRSLPRNYSGSLVNGVANIIRKYQMEHHNLTVQIDYDAVVSERDFYLTLLRRIRHVLTPGTHISITALASWCLDDKWLKDDVADEAVVMLFSIGSARKEIFLLLDKQKLDPGAQMDTSIGISINETSTNKKLKDLDIIGSAKRLYIFDSLPWTKSRFETISHEVFQQ